MLNTLKTHEKQNTNVLKIVVVWADHQTYEEQKGTDVCSFHIHYMCGTCYHVYYACTPYFLVELNEMLHLLSQCHILETNGNHLWKHGR